MKAKLFIGIIIGILLFTVIAVQFFTEELIENSLEVTEVVGLVEFTVKDQVENYTCLVTLANDSKVKCSEVYKEYSHQLGIHVWNGTTQDYPKKVGEK